ncbi:hypothetical protein CCACVL1_02194 [Corchorus capsularis]|uniref:Uncharacterized protein n=1 Tax=Corchorus capsularis TaxID=210143 RepID=A0A1R3KAF6_COCAP|nr:hypothetical protein CCACVL1_02194 [Corchorus capsularis]
MAHSVNVRNVNVRYVYYTTK